MQDKRILENIISRLSGHPYALTLIAKNYSITEIKQMIDNSIIWKGTIAQIAADIASTIYNRLPQNLKKVLSYSCIFSKSFDITANSFVSDISESETFQALTELTQRGLIRELQAGKYDIHILVREYVLGQLPPEEKREIHSKAADFYLNQKRIPLKDRKSIEDIYSLLDAVDHLMCAEKYEEASKLFLEQELDEQLYCWSHFMELVDIYNSFIEKDIPKDTLSIFLGNLGLVYRDLGGLPKAKEYYEKALIISRECQNRMSECTQLVNLGDVFHFFGQFDESIEFHNKAKNLIEDLKNNNLISEVKLRKLEGRNIGCLGNAIRGKGDLQKAKEYYEQAIAISREVGDKRYEGIWLGDLGNINADEDNFLKAIESYSAAHKIAQEVGDRRHESWWLGVLGQTYIKMKDFQKAKDCLKHALSISEKIFYRRGISSQLAALGEIYFSMGEFLKAIECFVSLAKEMKETDKDRKQERLYLKTIGDAYFAYGEYSKSISYYEKVLDINREVKDRKDEIVLLTNLGDRYTDLRQFEKAIKHYNPAIDINNLFGDKQTEVILLDRLEKVYLKSGQYEKAMDLFTQAQNIIGEQFTTFVTQFEKTIESFENELNNARSSGDRKQEMIALSNLGGIYFKIDQNKKAIEYYTQALNIAGELADWQKKSEFLSKVGDIFISLNQFKKAIACYEKAIAVVINLGDSESEGRYRKQLCEVYLSEADYFLSKGQIETALRKCLGVIKISPDYVNAQIKMGDIYTKLGREKDTKFFGKGIKSYSNAINIEPTNSSAYMGRATCHALKGNLENALSDYEMTFKLDPSNTGAILSKIEVEIWVGRYSDARSTYGKWHKNFILPRDRIVAAWLICTTLALDGMSYDDYIEPLRNYDISLLDDEWGISDIEQYFDKLSKAAFPPDRLAKALEIHGLFKKHFKKTEEIMKEIETDLFKIEPLLLEAEAYLSNGNFEKSLEKCNEAITIAPISAKAYILRGTIYKAFQEPDNYLDLAIQDYTKAIELDPQNSLAFNKRGDCYAYKDRGNLDEVILDKALSDYQASIRLDPNNITAILSKTEIEIWLGRYSDARNTYRNNRLHQTVMSPQYRLMASWLMCLALSLDGMPYEDYLYPLKDDLVIISREDYNPEDIEPYLSKLKKSNIPTDYLNNALKIHDLFLKHYREEIKYLIKKAESYINSRDFNRAIQYLNQLIENSTPRPYYFKRRAFCHRMIKNMDRAIEDFNTALKLDSGDGVTYWERGACYHDKAFLKGIDQNERQENLEKALKDYKSSIERIPSSQEALLAIIDIDLWFFKFDDAIRDYGASKPYIQTREYQVIRSWYGCLALILAGDTIKEEDEKPLNDQSIRLKWYHWAVFSMDIFFRELEQKGFDKEKLQKAKEIHQKFIDHFDDQPFDPTI